MSRFAEGVRITWISLGLNLFLGLGKVLVGLWAQSRALVADGLHSISDLGTDLAVLLGFRYAGKPKDENHPYGHHKIASLISGGIGLSIISFSLLLLYQSIRALAEGRTAVPSALALAAALFSIMAKEWLFFRTRGIARRIQSRLLLANAWHHRTDSVSSLVAAAGISAALLGGERHAYFDTMAAVVLCGYLAMEGGKLLWGALRDLVDTAPERIIVDDLREHILPTPGVFAYHAFRARRCGDMIEVDFHLLVDPLTSVEEGHRIARKVKNNIMKTHPEVIEVLIHVEPFLPEHASEKGLSDSRPLQP